MVRSSRLAHDGSTKLSCCRARGAPGPRSRWGRAGGTASVPTGRPSRTGGTATARRCDRTRSTSSGPGTRSARGNADRRSARVRHSGAGCNHAPRPGSRRRGSGMTTPSTATTRRRSSAGARVRHPTHVLTGPWSVGRHAWVRSGRRTASECSASPVRVTPHRGYGRPPPRRPARIRPRRPAGRPPRPPGGRRRCGCRCATR